MSDEERRTRGAAEIRKIAYLEAEVSAIRDAFSTLVERLDDIDRSWKSMTVQEQVIVNFSAEDLDGLPWRPYRSGRGEWIFSNVAPTLAEFLRNEPTRILVIGGYEYRLQGRDDRFISRRPADARFIPANKQKEATPKTEPIDISEDAGAHEDC